MAGLHFDITGDNSNFLHKLEETRNGVRTTSKQIEESGMSIEQMFGRMTTAAAAFGISLGAKQLISDITRVRGEFQQLEVAFNTMLGSKEQANTLMSQLVYTAAKTPFDLQGVANGAKQLLAYGTAAEDVNETLIRLGDIASGLSIPLNDLVWLYGTTMTQGRLFTQDLRQFMGRGIPLADELAKQFGVTKDKVGELVTAGKVGFPEVQKAIEAMTDEGGKFGGLMEEQSKTITGQISNIEDAISTMFNKIGKENESIINSGLSGVSYLVEHWEAVVTAIESAAVAYGTYKAAVMTAAALHGVEQTLKVDTEIDGLKTLLEVKKQSNNTDIAAAVASGKLTESKAAELTMLREELALKISSLETEKGLAEKAYANALLNFNTAEKRLQTAQDAVDGMDDWIARAEDLGNTELANTYRTEFAEKSVELQSAAIARNSAQKALNDAATKKKSASEALNTVTTQANTVANHANTASMNIMKLAAIQLTNILKGMWATLMANPLLLVAGAVTGLGFALYKVATAESEAETATRMYNKAIDEQQKKQNEYKDNIDKLIKTIEDNNRSEGERLQAFEALKAEYPTILDSLLTEAEYLKEIAKYKKLIAGEDNNRARQSDAEILEEEKRKLKYFQDVRRKGTSTTLVDMDGNGWATDNVDDAIKAQQVIVNKAIAKVASHDVTSFLGNIQNMKDNDIVSVINAINLSLKAIGKNGDDAIAIVAELGGEFSKTQLSTIKNALETEQASRSSEKNTGKEWIEKYKNNYLNAKKELDNFLNTENELTEFEYEKKLKELTEKKDEAEKKYKSVGGVTGSKADKQQGDRLKQQEQLAEQLLSLRRKNQQDEINLRADGTEKKLAQIDLDYQKELDAIESAREKAKKDGTYKQQSPLFDEAEENAFKRYQQAVTKTHKQEAEAQSEDMNRYLKEYGTFQQKKDAITKEYNDKMAKATTEGDKKLLQKEMEEAVQSIDLSELKQNMDWEQVFGNLDKVSTDTLKKLKANLKDFISSQKDLSPENFKELVDAIERIDDKVSERNPFEAMSVSFKSLKDATDAQREAQEAYNKVLEEGTDEEKKNAKATLESAKNSKQKALYEATDALHKGINEIGQYVDAGNQVIGIMETLGIKTPEWLEGTMSGFGEMLDGLGNIDLMKPMSIITGGLQTIKGALTSITSLGGVINWSRSNAKEVAETINRLTERNEILGKSIDRLTDIMEKSAGSKAISAYEEARKNQQEKNENLLDIAQAQASYHNSHKSWQYYMRWTDEQLKWAQENVDASFTGTNSLWNLTPEQMNKLLSNVNIYEQIKNAGKGGYGGRVMEDLEEYAGQAGKIADLEASINESLMNVSFDSLRSSFLDSLMDMEKDAKGFSDDFSEMMQRALLDFSLGETFDNELKDWYNDVAKSISENSGKLSETQMADFKKRYDDIVNAAMYERDKIAELTGYTGGKDSTREASQRGIATASQDSVDENNGRLAVMQGHTYSINENVNRMATSIDTIAAHTVNLSCLTSIDKTMQSILSMRDASLTHLSNIDSHTARLEAIENAIVFMKNDINTMLIKGLKLSKN